MSALTGTEAVLDPWTLMDLLRFGKGRGEEALSQLLAAFSREAADRLISMRMAAATGDLTTTRDVAHGLRGSSSAVAATLVAECCAAIEASSVAGDRESALQAINELGSRLDGALSALERVFNTGSTTTESEGK